MRFVKKRERGSKGNTWWWNVQMREAVSRKKDPHNTVGLNSTEENKRRYEGMKKKAVSKAMKEKAVEVLTEFKKMPNWDV